MCQKLCKHYIKVFIFKRVHNSVGKMGGEKYLNSPVDFPVIIKYHSMSLIRITPREFFELIPDIVPFTASGGTKDTLFPLRFMGWG